SGEWSRDQGLRPIPRKPTRSFRGWRRFQSRCHRASRWWRNIRRLPAAGIFSGSFSPGAGLFCHWVLAYHDSLGFHFSYTLRVSPFLLNSQRIEQAILFQTLWAASANFGTTESGKATIHLLAYFRDRVWSGVAHLLFDVTVTELFRVQLRGIRRKPLDVNLRMRCQIVLHDLRL